MPLPRGNGEAKVGRGKMPLPLSREGVALVVLWERLPGATGKDLATSGRGKMPLLRLMPLPLRREGWLWWFCGSAFQARPATAWLPLVAARCRSHF
jgi:hypothetical protein